MSNKPKDKTCEIHYKQEYKLYATYYTDGPQFTMVWLMIFQLYGSVKKIHIQ